MSDDDAWFALIDAPVVGNSDTLHRACESKGVRRALNITNEDFAELQEHGDSRCWICRRPEHVADRSLSIDHDHRTGHVRGLLCSRCNRRLGGMHDVEWLRKAADYLDRARARFADTCEECDVVVRQWECVLQSGDGAVMRYRCGCGNVWLCSWSTVGIDHHVFG